MSKIRPGPGPKSKTIKAKAATVQRQRQNDRRPQLPVLKKVKSLVIKLRKLTQKEVEDYKTNVGQQQSSSNTVKRTRGGPLSKKSAKKQELKSSSSSPVQQNDPSVISVSGETTQGKKRKLEDARLEHTKQEPKPSTSKQLSLASSKSSSLQKKKPSVAKRTGIGRKIKFPFMAKKDSDSESQGKIPKIVDFTVKKKKIIADDPLKCLVCFRDADESLTKEDWLLGRDVCAQAMCTLLELPSIPFTSHFAESSYCGSCYEELKNAGIRFRRMTELEDLNARAKEIFLTNMRKSFDELKKRRPSPSSATILQVQNRQAQNKLQQIIERIRGFEEEEESDAYSRDIQSSDADQLNSGNVGHHHSSTLADNDTDSTGNNAHAKKVRPSKIRFPSGTRMLKVPECDDDEERVDGTDECVTPSSTSTSSSLSERVKPSKMDFLLNPFKNKSKRRRTNSTNSSDTPSISSIRNTDGSQAFSTSTLNGCIPKPGPSKTSASRRTVPAMRSLKMRSTNAKENKDIIQGTKTCRVVITRSARVEAMVLELQQRTRTHSELVNHSSKKTSLPNGILPKVVNIDTDEESDADSWTSVDFNSYS